MYGHMLQHREAIHRGSLLTSLRKNCYSRQHKYCGEKQEEKAVEGD